MFLITSYKHLQEAAATFHIKAFGVFCARGRRGDLVQQIISLYWVLTQIHNKGLLGLCCFSVNKYTHM